MIFTVTTSGSFYSDAEIRTDLEKIGFTFEQNKYKEFEIDGEPRIEIKDLSELIEFTDKWGEIIISDKHIEIYDSFRE